MIYESHHAYPGVVLPVHDHHQPHPVRGDEGQLDLLQPVGISLPDIVDVLTELFLLSSN